jgi:hypothetical protein
VTCFHHNVVDKASQHHLGPHLCLVLVGVRMFFRNIVVVIDICLLDGFFLLSDVVVSS